MNIEVVTKHVPDEDQIRNYIEDKIDVAFGRIHTRVKQVTVRLQDESAGSTAFDGSCQIDVLIAPTGHVHVTAHGDSPRNTVMQAIRKMEQAIKNDIDRHRHSARIRHEQSRQA